MDTVLYILIILFGSASYIVGMWQVVRGSYRPNVFSRVVWLLLAVNSYAGVVLSKGSAASILLATVFLLGNLGICILSFWKGTYKMGTLEYICLALLVISGLVWMVYSAPLINLVIGLLAHLIGALPTYKKVWDDASSENTSFWSLFFIASLLSIFASAGDSIREIIFPIYFTLFDGSMTVLSMRKLKTFKH